MADDLIGDLFPALSPVTSFFNILIEPGDYPVITAPDIIPLFLAIIAYTYLHQFFQSGDFLQGVVHDAGMAVDKIFIRLAQVAVRIDLQDAKVSVFLRDGFVIAEGVL
jgi:hypothetical protein